MRPAVLLPSILVVAALAGCVANTRPVDLPALELSGIVNSLEGYVDPFLMGHDHADAKLHSLYFHAKQLAHHPLGGTNLKSSGAHVVDIRDHYLFVGAYGLAADVDGGVYIFDIATPESPKLTGVFRLPGNLGGDRAMEATDDANWVVLGTEAIDCANHVAPFGPGLFLIDARNKADPKLSDYLPDPTGVHSVMVHRVAGKDYAVTLGGSKVDGSNIHQIDTATGKFKGVGKVGVSHDGAIYDDPVLGKTLLYVADVENLKVYDFSDPAAPKKLGAWAPTDVKGHYVHAVAVDWIEGHRIIVTESEDWNAQPSPVWVLDATDLGNMELLGTWTNPARAPANAKEAGSSLAFSTHNPRLENGILYLAHYHGGAWILDVRTLKKAAAPEVMGYFVPHDDNGGYKPQSSQSSAPLPTNPVCSSFGFSGDAKDLSPQGIEGFTINELPNVMDVEVKGGILYAADLHTGLYVIKYDATTVMPADHKH